MDATLECKDLINDVLQNPDKMDEMTSEQLLELQKNINLYGVVFSENEELANICISNFRWDYLKKLQMTTMVGYLYRVLEEWGDDETQEASEDERNTVRRFLNRNFEFNPDRHVRGSYQENPDDPERLSKQIAAMNNMSTSNEERPSDETLVSALQHTNTSVSEALAEVDVLLANSPDIQTQTSLRVVKDKLESVRVHVQPMIAADTAKGVAPVYNVDPPADVFHHINRYQTNHFEELIKATEILYGDKPDIEYAIQFIKSFVGEGADDEAALHRKQHEDDVIAPITTISNNGWVLLGPYQKNRERVEFYNKNTEIMKRMMEQMEYDHKLGRDLLRKRVKREASKNIAQHGPHDPGLEEYRKAVGTIEDLGAERVLKQEDKDKLAAAVRTKEMYEVPEDAIQVDMFRTNEEGKLVRDKFYTQAEAPTFINDSSTPYQPVKPKIQMMRDREGNKKSIDEIRQQVQKNNDSNNVAED